MNKLELLKAARQVISTPETWTQRATARDANGEKENALEPEAVCWCSWGALLKASSGGVPSSAAFMEAENCLNKAMEGSYIYFNDSHSHEEVLAGWDKAIESCPTQLK
jgi:hypothetical protein